ncbi:MAG: serine/threonine-protein kinase, partial [Planctomycetota bacterium]
MSDELGESDGRSPVEVLAEEYLRRRAMGEDVSIEKYAAAHPKLAEDIREVFPAVEAMKSLSAEWKRKVVQPHQEGPELPFQLGDYRLERKVGRGGMGIVYEAVHTSLQRRVAVKILRLPSLHSEKDVHRFHQEAQAAAKLHHSNIVPVFDFGEAKGFHYIAMQLIQGEGLDSLIDRLEIAEGSSERTPRNEQRETAKTRVQYNTSEYWQTVADIGIQAANALYYAHCQGTVHRDIKPGNLLLDDDGVVWVADFGLARQSDPGRRSETGTLSGTLRYLAPEHFHGRCDERTDQYGLGLSLYELVTLQPVVADSGSHAEIMRRITEAKVPPPRQLNTRIPLDLETIILKCISPGAGDRYVDCNAVAEDLQRYVDGIPIEARPVSRVERLWRWAKRYPALAATSAASAALLLLVAVVATLGYRAEFRQRQRAETTSAYARDALDTVFDSYLVASTSELGIGDHSTPVLSQETAQMLERLLPIFDQLAELDDQSPEMRSRATEARRRVGDIQQQLGQFEHAIASYQRAASEYKVSETLSGSVRALKLSNVFNEIGRCQIKLGKTQESRESHATALRQLQPFVDQEELEVVWQLARTHFLLTRRLRPGESPYEEQLGAPRRPDLPPPDGSRPRRPKPHTEFFGSSRPPRGGPRHEARDFDRSHLNEAIRLIESLEPD